MVILGGAVPVGRRDGSVQDLPGRPHLVVNGDLELLERPLEQRVAGLEVQAVSCDAVARGPGVDRAVPERQVVGDDVARESHEGRRARVDVLPGLVDEPQGRQPPAAFRGLVGQVVGEQQLADGRLGHGDLGGQQVDRHGAMVGQRLHQQWKPGQLGDERLSPGHRPPPRADPGTPPTALAVRPAAPVSPSSRASRRGRAGSSPRE